MGRWLAVDHGVKRIGLAIGETGPGIASPLEVVEANEALTRIREIIGEYDLEGIVVGWPLNMDDTEGPQAHQARRFAQTLTDATGMDVRMWDERLSSFEADSALAGQLTRNKRKRRQDAIAAATFLQDFLSCDGPHAAPTPADLGDAPKEA